MEKKIDSSSQLGELQKKEANILAGKESDSSKDLNNFRQAAQETKMQAVVSAYGALAKSQELFNLRCGEPSDLYMMKPEEIVRLDMESSLSFKRPDDKPTVDKPMVSNFLYETIHKFSENTFFYSLMASLSGNLLDKSDRAEAAQFLQERLSPDFIAMEFAEIQADLFVPTCVAVPKLPFITFKSGIYPRTDSTVPTKKVRADVRNSMIVHFLQSLLMQLYFSDTTIVSQDPILPIFQSIAISNEKAKLQFFGNFALAQKFYNYPFEKHGIKTFEKEKGNEHFQGFHSGLKHIKGLFDLFGRADSKRNEVEKENLMIEISKKMAESYLYEIGGIHLLYVYLIQNLTMYTIEFDINGVTQLETQKVINFITKILQEVAAKEKIDLKAFTEALKVEISSDRNGRSSLTYIKDKSFPLVFVPSKKIETDPTQTQTNMEHLFESRENITTMYVPARYSPNEPTPKLYGKPLNTGDYHQLLYRLMAEISAEIRGDAIDLSLVVVPVANTDKPVNVIRELAFDKEVYGEFFRKVHQKFLTEKLSKAHAKIKEKLIDTGRTEETINPSIPVDEAFLETYIKTVSDQQKGIQPTERPLEKNALSMLSVGKISREVPLFAKEDQKMPGEKDINDKIANALTFYAKEPVSHTMSRLLSGYKTLYQAKVITEIGLKYGTTCTSKKFPVEALHRSKKKNFISYLMACAFVAKTFDEETAQKIIKGDTASSISSIVDTVYKAKVLKQQEEQIRMAKEQEAVMMKASKVMMKDSKIIIMDKESKMELNPDKKEDSSVHSSEHLSEHLGSKTEVRKPTEEEKDKK